MLKYLMKLFKMKNYSVDLIKQFESFKSNPYLCPAGVPTIGYGSTEYENGVKVTLNDKAISKDYAEKLLNHHVEKYILPKIKQLNLNFNQRSALISWCYNLGTKYLKNVIIDNNTIDWKRMMKYNKSNGKTLPGLVRRRQAEYNLANS